MSIHYSEDEKLSFNLLFSVFLHGVYEWRMERCKCMDEMKGEKKNKV